jgi:outer membrane protein assembly complex protein YaeT
MAPCGRAGLILVAAIALAPCVARAVPIDAVDPGTEWHLGRVRIEGAAAFGRRALRGLMLTESRPWWAPWRPSPAFDPVTLAADLDRLRDFYRRQGYYRAKIGADVELPERGDVLGVVITLGEGAPARVARVDLTYTDAADASGAPVAVRPDLPIVVGVPFTQAAYDQAVTELLRFDRERGHARVAVTRSATVDVRDNTAVVRYVVDRGPPCRFGEVTVLGTAKVDAALVRREVGFRAGAPFRERLVERTRRNVAALRLFRTVKITEAGEGDRVDVRIQVQEQPPREVAVGVGFDTESLLGGFATWKHFNFLGGARQLGVTVRASQLERTIEAAFLQPRFPVRSARTTLNFLEGQEAEDPFTVARTRVSPRIEWRQMAPLELFVAHRFEYDVLTDVNDVVPAAFPGIAPETSFLSGLTVGAEWSRLDDPLDPQSGWAAKTTVESVGTFLGGDVSFVRLRWESRTYQRITRGLTAALRLRVGAADPVGSSREIPMFERFYLGGIDSVRGYERWHVGPRVDGKIAGGRTSIEWSVELRHAITERLSGVAFLDAGQVSVESFDFPFDDLRYGAGVGARYRTPIGPIAIDLGFPTNPPGNDQLWQIHVSAGARF